MIVKCPDKWCKFNNGGECGVAKLETKTILNEFGDFMTICTSRDEINKDHSEEECVEIRLTNFELSLVIDSLESMEYKKDRQYMCGGKQYAHLVLNIKKQVEGKSGK